MWKNKTLKLLFLFLTEIIFCDPPDPITDLKVVEVHFKQAKLSWSVPGSTNPVAVYQIRISTFNILSTEQEWAQNSSETGYPYRVIITTSSLPEGPTVVYTITGLSNGVGYYFAVKSSTATDANPDDNSLWSAIQSGSVYTERYALPQNSQPQQFSHIWPVHSVVVTSQTVIPFDWEDAVDTDVLYGDSLKYEFYWSTIPTLQTQTPPDLTLAQVVSNLTTSYVEIPTNYFLDNTTYYWRVKVVDSENAYKWSSGIFLGREPVFIINHTPEPPSSFTLVSPVNKSTTTSLVVFDWTDPTDPDPQDVIKYYLYISSQGQNIGFVLAVGDITWSSYTLNSVFGRFVENTTYWWYVVAKDDFNLESYSPTWYFIINNYEEPPTSNFLTSPGTTIYFNLDPYNNNHIVFTFHPTFYWTLSSDPDLYNTVYYQIFISSYSDIPDESNSVFYSITPIYTTYYWLTNMTLQDNTTYFWRVRIWDEPYSGYAIYSSTVYWFYTCVENLPPTAAQLLSPVNGSTTSYFYPELKWTPGYDTGYNCAVSSQCLIYWTDNDTTTVSGLLPSTSFYVITQKLKNNTTYYWQIITYDNAYPPPQKSSSSAVFTFYVVNLPPATFNLLVPNNASIIETSNVQLFWSESLDPENEQVYYQIVYSTDNFNTFCSSSGITNTNFVLYNLQDNTTYYWYVYAYDIWGQVSSANTTFYFVVDTISSPPANFNLLSPANNTVMFVPYTTFYWEDTYDPDPYETVVYKLSISTATNFDVVKFSTITFDTHFYVPLGILELNTTYYWEVVAISSRSGFTRATNSPFCFYIYNTAPTKPVLALPYNGVLLTTSTVELQWSNSVDFENDEFYYELYYSSDNKVSWVKIVLSQQQNRYTLYNLVDDCTYYWYVVVVDTFMNTNVSDEFVFYTQYLNYPPTPAQVLTPLDYEVIRLPYRISWSSSVDTDIFDSVVYKVEISSNENFVPLIIQKTLQETEFYLDEKLQPATYYLRVVSYDRYLGVSTSAVVRFILPSYYINNYSPQNNTVINKLPIKFSFSSVEPVVVDDTVTYKIVMSTYPDFKHKKEFLTLNTFYYILSPPEYPATYYWYITAYDSYNRSGDSPVWRFVIPLTYPPAPKNVKVSTSALGLVLSWEEVLVENFWCYNVYRGYEPENVEYLVYSGTHPYFVDQKGLYSDYFYTVKTVNQFGTESIDNIIVGVKQAEQINFYLSEDKNVFVTVSVKENIDFVSITRKQEEENETVKYVYDIKSVPEKLKIEGFYEIQFILPVDSSYSIEYYDGIQWINMPYLQQYNKLIIKTQYFGKYRVVKKVLPVKKLTVIGCSPVKRIITPNNDGKNDYIEFHYDPDSYLDGELYDIKLRKVCNLKRRDKNILYFDGRDNDNKLLPAGVYIYNITVKPSGETFSDTIIIKY